MVQEQPPITVLILENRQMIAAILADLLKEAGYHTEMVTTTADLQEILPKRLPALLLADIGMIQARKQADWEPIEELARSLDVPISLFSCSPTQEEGEIMILRSPADFATVVDSVKKVLRTRPAFLGMALVEKNLLDKEELEAALRIQRELTKVGRPYPLGDLLVRLDFVSQEAIEQALREQES